MMFVHFLCVLLAPKKYRSGFGVMLSVHVCDLTMGKGAHDESSRVSFTVTFFEDCGWSEGLMTTTCIKTVAGGKQGHHAPCMILSLYEASFVSVKFNGVHKTVYKDELKSGHPQIVGYYRI